MTAARIAPRSRSRSTITWITSSRRCTVPPRHESLRSAGDAAVTLPDLRQDDQVHHSRFVFERHKRETPRSRRTLPEQNQPRHQYAASMRERCRIPAIVARPSSNRDLNIRPGLSRSEDGTRHSSCRRLS